MCLTITTDGIIQNLEKKVLLLESDNKSELIELLKQLKISLRNERDQKSKIKQEIIPNPISNFNIRSSVNFDNYKKYRSDFLN